MLQSLFQKLWTPLLPLVLNPSTGDPNAYILWVVIALLGVSAVVSAVIAISS